jgi:hypothetical protein
VKHRLDERAQKHRVEDPAEDRVQKHRIVTLPMSALRVLPSMGLAAPPVTSTPVPLDHASGASETAITVVVGLTALVAGIGLAYAVTRPANPVRLNAFHFDR